MSRLMLKSKIHRARLTGAELRYEGSITIDAALLEEADMLPGEQAHVLNLNNGSRIVTYIIEGPAHSGVVLLNGPAAREGQIGDEVIVLTYQAQGEHKAVENKPRVVFVDERNRPRAAEPSAPASVCAAGGLESVGRVRRENEALSILEIDGRHEAALLGLEPGDQLDVLYCMNRLGPDDTSRSQVRPRGDLSRPLRGVFATRSPMRPNPIGVAKVTLENIEGRVLTVEGLDAPDGSPIVDIKAAREPLETQEVIDAWGRTHDRIGRALAQRFSGEDCAGLFRKTLREAGAEAAEPGGEPLSPEQIGRRIMDFEKHWKIRGAVRECSPDVFEREVAGCPWSGFHPLSCRLLGWYMEGLVARLNPDCRYRLPALMPAGDPVCVWRIERVHR